jgi:Leucine-rich repeat (LRR) protein
MEVPTELFRLKNLKTVFLANNNLCLLPSEITHLAMLHTLIVRLSRRSDHDLTTGTLFQVNRNQLTSLPHELGLLTNLKTFDVRHLWQIDRDLTTPTATSFQVGFNQLTSLPASIGQLTQLETLAVRISCGLVYDLTPCSCAQVHKNQLKWLPVELPKLTYLFVRRLGSFSSGS